MILVSVPLQSFVFEVLTAKFVAPCQPDCVPKVRLAVVRPVGPTQLPTAVVQNSIFNPSTSRIEGMVKVNVYCTAFPPGAEPITAVDSNSDLEVIWPALTCLASITGASVPTTTNKAIVKSNGRRRKLFRITFGLSMYVDFL